MFFVSFRLWVACVREKVSCPFYQRPLNYLATRSPRVGKLFWQSTASTTSTLSTTTQCFAVSHATNALVACKRKKRAVEPDVEAKVEISASKSINAANMDHLEGEEEVEPGVEAVPTRQARLRKTFISSLSWSISTCQIRPVLENHNLDLDIDLIHGDLNARFNQLHPERFPFVKVWLDQFWTEATSWDAGTKGHSSDIHQT